MMVVGARKHTKEEKKQRAKNNDELEKGTKCNRCHKVGHWERECLDDDVLQDQKKKNVIVETMKTNDAYTMHVIHIEEANMI